ncbi:uncharacterized protein A4U43_C04F3500 [Asparagus officinalis]|uniref:Uncharacterized protein n=1 Tax=Asparagus officinalis TaxID=4686 RepID=A0A5P1EYH0_ASPOF|nr:uncharacterized protein A4U43_C04F3500 [Asparagus officinalis]
MDGAFAEEGGSVIAIRHMSLSRSGGGIRVCVVEAGSGGWFWRKKRGGKCWRIRGPGGAIGFWPVLRWRGAVAVGVVVAFRCGGSGLSRGRESGWIGLRALRLAVQVAAGWSCEVCGDSGGAVRFWVMAVRFATWFRWYGGSGSSKREEQERKIAEELAKHPLLLIVEREAGAHQEAGSYHSLHDKIKRVGGLLAQIYIVLEVSF